MPSTNQFLVIATRWRLSSSCSSWRKRSQAPDHSKRSEHSAAPIPQKLDPNALRGPTLITAGLSVPDFYSEVSFGQNDSLKKSSRCEAFEVQPRRMPTEAVAAAAAAALPLKASFGIMLIALPWRSMFCLASKLVTKLSPTD